MDIECPTSTGIQIRVEGLCIWEIDSQTSLGTVKYVNRNLGTASEIENSAQRDQYQLASHHKSLPIPLPSGYEPKGTLTGNSLLTGSAGGHVDLFVD